MGVSRERQARREPEGLCRRKSGLWRETAGFMRVYRPSSCLMRKDSNSSPHKRKEGGEGAGARWGEAEGERGRGEDRQRKQARKRDKGRR